jgi:hypothetical protein
VLKGLALMGNAQIAQRRDHLMTQIDPPSFAGLGFAHFAIGDRTLDQRLALGEIDVAPALSVFIYARSFATPGFAAKASMLEAHLKIEKDSRT